MNLSYRQQHQLHVIEARLRRSEPNLAATMALFGTLCLGQAMPAWEQATKPGRFRRAVAWIVTTLIATIAVMTVLLRKVVAVATARWRARAGVPAAKRERPGREADAQHGAE
jgi:hypothetical protein